MKFTKLTKKLLLSALSLGLAVVTLTTTTFAWYTSSTEAEATGAGASTSSQTSDSSLMISSDYKVGNTVNSSAKWGPSANVTASVDNLIPLQWDASTKDLKGYGASNSATEGYYEFKLWFKTTGSTKNVDVYLKAIDIKNSIKVNGGQLTPYPTLVSGDDVAEGCPTEAYSVDVVRALDLIIASGSDKEAYDLSNMFTANYLDHVGSFKNGVPNAKNYYNQVMSEPLDGSETITAQLDHTKVGTIVSSENAEESILEVTFTIFLNGWDQYCFDACRGQSFVVSLDFTTNTK